MKEIIGDLISLAEEGKFNVIVHGCNCFHTMGFGIARQIKSFYPEAYHADLQHGGKGEKEKLGKFTNILVQGPLSSGSNSFTIINAYTQFEPGPNYNYDAIQEAFKNIKKEFGGKGYRFGIPRIGAGIAGGDWNIIQPIIEKEMEGEDLTLVIFHLDVVK